MNLRIWDAAQTHRLNKAHWKTALVGQTINQHLVMHLETLRTRCEYEIANNTTAEGIVNSHMVDMFGEEGPLLQVQSDDESYNRGLEEIWRAWWERPDLNGQLAGVDILQLWWRSLWVNGEYLAQIANARETAAGNGRAKDNGPVAARLRVIDPRRLGGVTVQVGDPKVLMGVRRDETGRPLSYMIAKPLDLAFGAISSASAEEIPASEIIHGFRTLVPDQVRGVPWLTTALPVIADLRDYDQDVLTAARQAAQSGAILWTDHQEAQFFDVDESISVPMERGQMTTIPPGWKVDQMTPQQPSARYVDFRKERMGDLGRGVDMPGMITRRDSAGHNYSSARFDDQGYRRAINCLRGWLRRQTLDRLVRLVAREATLSKALAAGPGNVRYVWNWPAAPHVDPIKEGRGVTERLNNGTSTLRDECAAQGRDWRETIEQRGRERELLEAARLPVPGAKAPTGAGGMNAKGNSDAKNGKNGKDGKGSQSTP